MSQSTGPQGHQSRLSSDDFSPSVLLNTVEHILRKAEARFGERDRSYRVSGVEFHDGNPDLYYPNSDRDIVIRLCRRRQSEPIELWYELAHECVHLLAPSGGMNASVLEEGLAVTFAEDYLREEHGVREYHPMGEEYLEARALVRCLPRG